jgi:Flp pilus assembly protein TadD
MHSDRTQALRALGRFDEAVSAAVAALELEPSNPLLSNRLLLTKIQSGNLAAVRSEVKSRSGMASLEPGQIMASAALAAVDGDMNLCLTKLSYASQLLDQNTRRILLSDPVFAPFLGEILARSSSAELKLPQ